MNKKILEFSNFKDTKQIYLKDIYAGSLYSGMEDYTCVKQKLDDEFKDKIVEFMEITPKNNKKLQKGEVFATGYDNDGENKISYFYLNGQDETNADWKAISNDYPITVFLAESDAKKFGL